jgi:hypothetical protein
MPFLYAIDIGSPSNATTNQPSSTTGFISVAALNSLNIKQFYEAPADTIFVNPVPGGDWSLRTTDINSAVDAAVALGYYGVVFDEELSSQHADPRSFYPNWVNGQADPAVDVVYNAFQAAYDYAKARAASQGNPDLKVGFYDFPSSTDQGDGYFNPLWYATNPTGYLYYQDGSNRNTDWYNKMLQRLQRCNKRWNGSSHTTTPFVVDFLSRAAYSNYGNSIEAMEQWSQSNTVSTELTNTVFPTVPNYPHTQPLHHISSAWRMLAYNAYAMQKTLDTLINANADGVILWEGWFCSYTSIDWLFTPTGTEAEILANWKTITNGAFNINVCKQSFPITGINTATANSMSEVAGILQTAIRAQMGAVGNLLGQQFPLDAPTGNVSVAWVWGSGTYKGFVLNVDSNGSNSPLPPNWSRTDFSFTTNSNGYNLNTAALLGVPGVNPNAAPTTEPWIYGNLNSRDPDEYTKWWENSEWWPVFKNAAAGTTPTDVSNTNFTPSEYRGTRFPGSTRYAPCGIRLTSNGASSICSTGSFEIETIVRDFTRDGDPSGVIAAGGNATKGFCLAIGYISGVKSVIFRIAGNSGTFTTYGAYPNNTATHKIRVQYNPSNSTRLIEIDGQTIALTDVGTANKDTNSATGYVSLGCVLNGNIICGSGIGSFSDGSAFVSDTFNGSIYYIKISRAGVLKTNLVFNYKYLLPRDLTNNFYLNTEYTDTYSPGDIAWVYNGNNAVENNFRPPVGVRLATNSRKLIFG